MNLVFVLYSCVSVMLHIDFNEVVLLYTGAV